MELKKLIIKVIEIKLQNYGLIVIIELNKTTTKFIINNYFYFISYEHKKYYIFSIIIFNIFN